MCIFTAFIYVCSSTFKGVKRVNFEVNFSLKLYIALVCNLLFFATVVITEIRLSNNPLIHKENIIKFDYKKLSLDLDHCRSSPESKLSSSSVILKQCA